MAKKPFLVTVEIEIPIFAEDEKSIRSNYAFREALQEATSSNYSLSVGPLDRIPDGWDESCFVYGADGMVTLKEALNWNKREQPPEDTLPLFTKKG